MGHASMAGTVVFAPNTREQHELDRCMESLLFLA